MSQQRGEQPGEQEQDEAISEQELQSRVIYTLFLPAIRLARHFAIDLSVMKEWMEMAYFHELRREGLKQREIAEVMGVSMSKVSLLSRQLKGNFLRAEQEQELPRRIEFMLWAEPLSQARLHQVLTEVAPEEIDAALEELFEQGHVERVQQGTTEVYRLKIQTDRRVWDGWVARVDGLQNLLGNVADVVQGRFFTREARAFARTLTFRLRHDRLDALHELYERGVFDPIVVLDQEASGGGDGEDEAPIEEMSISVLWAPYQYLKRRGGS